jgi:hypothetical protein
MSRTVILSDQLFDRLQAEARDRGLSSVEQLLEEFAVQEPALEQRREAVDRIHALREGLRAKFGEMPDSTELIREDRLR